MLKKIDGWLTAPQGFVAAGVKAGIKASGKEDVAVILSTVPAATGAVFTQNKMCAAPVVISRRTALAPYAQAIVVNSGCANACTGTQGLADAQAMV
ncbi:MAG: bifunctional ornithine acetyltransferase/N-acetylglutamate synthase, partial [Acidaminococcaceae bacterium]